jgi:carbonic anhydrase/acetyltransferase-like protein (isoleucine patch superfamily)
MKELNKLLDRIIQRININLREYGFDVGPYVRDLIPTDKMIKFYAFYAITPHHPLNFEFEHSSLAGSYFLGKCRVTNSILYKSDIRGDELKTRDALFTFQNFQIPITRDEEIDIEDSFLIKTLVHNYSHDPETPERFFIRDTISTPYANIHGSPSDGCFLGPFATVDLTTMRDCLIGTFSYVQAGEIGHMDIAPGTVWIRRPEEFDFTYLFPRERLKTYIDFAAGGPPRGQIIDFVEERKEDFQRIFEKVNVEPPIPVPANASLDRFAVVDAASRIGDNVLVSQRAYLQDAWLGKGANAQEQSYIVNSRLEGFDVTAHGAKIIEADLGEHVFVGFNSFLRGRPGARLAVGRDSIIMPHTIIDIDAPLAIPPGQLVWGLVTSVDDLRTNSISLAELAKVETTLEKGSLRFEGDGGAFVTAFRDRIDHVLEANGSFFDGRSKMGHAQRNQYISFNIIQPYPRGDKEGLYPTIVIRP